MDRNCGFLADCVTHEASALRVMRRSYEDSPIVSRHRVELPPVCCPVSKNPKEGSWLSLRYAPDEWVLEVYSLQALLKKFVGGYPGSPCGRYPSERNMEGMITLVSQMVSDALSVPVHYRALCLLDTGELDIRGKVSPRC